MACRSTKLHLTRLFFAPSPATPVIWFLYLCVALAYLNMIVLDGFATIFPNGTDGVWINHLTVLGYVVPNAFFRSLFLFQLLKIVFIFSSIIWLCHWLLPYSAWICTWSFFLFTSIYLENSYYSDHQIHPVMTGFTILTAYYSWHWKPLKKTFDSLTSQSSTPSTDSVPIWWYSLFLYWIAITYFLSGVTKYINVGPGWANGATLQLWLSPGYFGHSFGKLGLTLKHLIGDFFPIALIAQVTIFLVELTSPLILPFRKVRILYGIILSSFHITSNLVMGFNFWAAALLDFYILTWMPLFGSFFKRQPEDYLE